MRGFLEKRSPTLISVLLHAALLLALWSTRVYVSPREPERMRPVLVHVVQPPETLTEHASVAPAAPAEPLPEVQRTSPNPSEEPSPEIAAVPMGESEEERPTPVQPTPVPPTASERRVASVPLDDQTLEQWRTEQQRREAEQRLRKSKLMAEVAQISAEAPGAKQPFASTGAEQGVVRLIDIKRYPQSMQQRFMRRYNIKIEHKYVRSGRGNSYINAVLTDKGSYLNRGGTGYYEVMTLSRELLALMADLEEKELRKRSLDPLRSSVREIVFGLREGANGQVDLVVTRFRAEAIE